MQRGEPPLLVTDRVRESGRRCHPDAGRCETCGDSRRRPAPEPLRHAVTLPSSPGHSATFGTVRRRERTARPYRLTRLLQQAGQAPGSGWAAGPVLAQAGMAADSRTWAPGGSPSCSAASPPLTAREISPALSV